MSTTMPNKDYIICVYSEGLEVTKLASVSARGLFSGSIQDVEFLREALVEAAQYDGTNGFYQLDKLAHSLDWKGRGLPPNMTTVEAFKSYVDDRPSRRVERWVPLHTLDPLVGDRQSDMKFADSLSSSLPWIVDRSSRETSWWKYHQNGRSEGSFKEPFRFDKLYTAGWFAAYSDVMIYYPPMNVFGEGLPFNFEEVAGDNYTSLEAAYFKPAMPEYNPNRAALFSAPYPDDAQLGKSLISSIAPVYFTGNFSGFSYDDTFMGVVGMDIAVDSISSFLDALQGTMTPTSFSMLVDTNFNTIVISSNTTARIYPERTGMEPERVTYDPEGKIVKDRRNATYLPSDTFLQDLTKLTSANWTMLLDMIRNEQGGPYGSTTLNITFTGETQPREFYVWFDKWEYVAKWYLLVFAPKDEVDTAVQVGAGPKTMALTEGDDESKVIALQAIKGYSMTGQGIIVNHGRVDMYLSPKNIPEWATLTDMAASRGTDTDSVSDMMIKNQWPYLLKAGQSLPIDFQVETQSLPVGTKMDYLVFHLQDANYPDCHHNSDVALSLSIQVNAQNCTDSSKVLSNGVCVCLAGTVGIANSCVNITILMCSVVFPLFALIIACVYFHGLARRKKADAVWEVKPSELKIGSNPVILGEGSFGLVVLAEYRGTLVAVKKVLPEKIYTKGSQEGKGLCTRDPFQSMAVQGMGCVARFKTSLKDMDEEDEEDEHEVDMERAQGKKHNRFRSPSFEAKFPTLRSVGKGGQEDNGFSRPVSAIEKIPALRSVGKNHRSSLLTLANSFGQNSRPSDDKLRREFIKEMRFVAKLRHPCIITVMGAVVDPREEPLLIMEYMENGSLYDLLHNGSMEWEGDLILSVLRDVSQGVLFLHKMEPPIAHGDLKAANVLIDSCFRSRVSDFGLSRGRQSEKKNLMATGTPYWMAPELLRGESSNTSSSDVYAFGIVLYEIYARKDPYEGEDCDIVFNEVCDPKINKRPPVPASMPPLVASLMHDCLVSNPEDRPTFDEIANRIKRFVIDDGQPVGLRRNDGRDFDLLLKVFPRHIANALREGRRVEPEHHGCITCFFSDIVSFTAIAGRISPEKVSDMLHRLFSKMDTLADKLGVFKVETIGDAWMGVTNCVRKQDNDHVKRIAEFSLGAIKAANETLVDEENPSMGTIQVRVGFHCGPVVATVVGNVAPRFSSIGDTINTASRMESASEPGKIHLSEVAATLLREQAPNFSTICRGARHIKGKGIMTTYFLEDRTLPEARETDPPSRVGSSSHTPAHSVPTVEAREENLHYMVELSSSIPSAHMASVEVSSDVPSECVQLPSEYMADSENF